MRTQRMKLLLLLLTLAAACDYVTFIHNACANNTKCSALYTSDAELDNAIAIKFDSYNTSTFCDTDPGLLLDVLASKPCDANEYLVGSECVCRTGKKCSEGIDVFTILAFILLLVIVVVSQV